MCVPTDTFSFSATLIAELYDTPLMCSWGVCQCHNHNQLAQRAASECPSHADVEQHVAVLQTAALVGVVTEKTRVACSSIGDTLVRRTQCVKDVFGDCLVADGIEIEWFEKLCKDNAEAFADTECPVCSDETVVGAVAESGKPAATTRPMADQNQEQDQTTATAVSGAASRSVYIVLGRFASALALSHTVFGVDL